MEMDKIKEGDQVWFWFVDSKIRHARIVTGKLAHKYPLSQKARDQEYWSVFTGEGEWFEIAPNGICATRQEAIEQLSKRLWRESAAAALLSAVIQGTAFVSTDEIHISEEDVDRMLQGKEVPFDVETIQAAILGSGEVN